jgi:hypothetical protein
MSRWDGTGIDIDFDPRRPPEERWYAVDTCSRERVSEWTTLAGACRAADMAAADLRDDNEKVRT